MTCGFLFFFAHSLFCAKCSCFILFYFVRDCRWEVTHSVDGSNGLLLLFSCDCLSVVTGLELMLPWFDAAYVE